LTREAVGSLSPALRQLATTSPEDRHQNDEESAAPGLRPEQAAIACPPSGGASFPRPAAVLIALSTEARSCPHQCPGDREDHQRQCKNDTRQGKRVATGSHDRHGQTRDLEDGGSAPWVFGNKSTEPDQGADAEGDGDGRKRHLSDRSRQEAARQGQQDESPSVAEPHGDMILVVTNDCIGSRARYMGPDVTMILSCSGPVGKCPRCVRSPQRRTTIAHSMRAAAALSEDVVEESADEVADESRRRSD
jgi:hypothetical protein